MDERTASQALAENCTKLDELIEALQDQKSDYLRTIILGEANWNHVGTAAHWVQVLDELVYPENH